MSMEFTQNLLYSHVFFYAVPNLRKLLYLILYIFDTQSVEKRLQ